MNAQERARRLRTMKRLALLLLLGMFALYIVTGVFLGQMPSLSYVHAFAEAATVGALADWFAVTALFRYPLGIPIPHTAIIQRRKDDIGATLARFVGENFLTPAALEPRLARFEFSRLAADWLDRPSNTERLSADLAGILSRLVEIGDNRALRDVTKQSLRSVLEQTQLTPLFAQVLEFVLLKDPDQVVVNELLALARRQLDNNRESLQSSISERTPWWLPRFVDRKIVDQLIEEVDTYLADSSDNDDEEARARLISTLTALIESMRSDPVLIERGESLKESLLDHPMLQSYLSRVVNDLSQWLNESLANPDSALRSKLSAAVAGLGNRLLEDESLKADIDTACRSAVLQLVESHHASLTSIITETVKGWDAEATAERIELQVGRDLQFIRINGTLVGGLVGLLLHSGWQLAAVL